MAFDASFTGLPVRLPKLLSAQLQDSVPVGEKTKHGYLLEQPNFSVSLCQSRRLAWYSAANVDMGRKQHIRRKDLTGTWRVEADLDESVVVGHPWYKASKKKLQRGHLTPADCMEWGDTEAEAIANANSTFFFSNAAPQVPELNGQVWSRLEMYISQEGLKTGNSRINVMTGPVLLPDDPTYIHHINGAQLQLPRMFWKVVWYIDKNGKLSRIGFLMSQESLLEALELIEIPTDRSSRGFDLPFGELGPFKTYQVNMSLLRSLTRFSFARARDPYTDSTPKALALERVDLPEMQLDSIRSAHQDMDIRINIKM
jgi:endonuclease G, mitochondrial